MNWYKLEKVREALQDDYGCELAPSAIGRRGGLEVWQRIVGGETHRTFLNYDSEELLLPEDVLLAAAEALQLPAREFLAAVKRRGGMYLGASPE